MEVKLLVCLLILSVFSHQIECKTRVYYIAAIDVEWDYAPSGRDAKNRVLLDNEEDSLVFTKKGPNRIGRIYKKTIYREYTDKTFTTRKAHRKDLGILGPVIRGELNDVITVYFKNMGTRPYTMHPHGVFYKKSSEGASYLDNTSGSMKSDDAVQPGKIHEYEWVIRKDEVPRDGDEPCIPWVYHSHYHPSSDINTGLVGILLTCKKGALDGSNKRKDVSKEMFMLLNVFDENKSWYIDENIKNKTGNPSSVKKDDDAFKESNLLHGINGLFYGNLEGLEVCVGTRVAWNLAVLGNEVDMHTGVFSGNMIEHDNHRTDAISLFPAHSDVGVMDVKQPGRWLFTCHVADHLSGGMYAYYNAKMCSSGGSMPKSHLPAGGKIRQYYITAEEVEWDYGPSGMNKYEGGALTAPRSSSATFFASSANRIGGKYIKALYFEYTNASFSEKKVRNASESYLGILGPIIRAEVGDEIHVTFKNLASRKYSIHPRGVVYNSSNQGLLYNDNTTINASFSVDPNATYTYKWLVPDSVAPTSNDWPCVSLLYTSGVDLVKDMYTGLIGPLVICKNGTLGSNGLPKGYDAQKFILMAVMDENKSWLLDKSMDKYCNSSKCNGISKEDEDFMESNKMHQVNGFMYGNMDGLRVCKDSNVLWHAFGIGTEVDMHGIYFHGNSFSLDRGIHKDSLALFPGEGITFSMHPVNEGTWGLVCRVNDHYNAGMKVTYSVDKCGSSKDEKTAGKKRKFYIGIVEREWDYAETNKSLLHGFDLNKDSSSKVFTIRSATRIGKVYKKAMYREFTDATFTKMKKRSSDMEHLGIMGPMIRAEEGDQIEVVLKNMATKNYSIQPHGLSYSKEQEGSVYMDNNKTKGKFVSPGVMSTYNWFVPKRSAPGSQDSACVTWAYFSAVDSVKDTNSGLIGPLIICRKGTLNADGKRKDVDKEFALLFTVMDENESWYLDDNIKKFADPTKVSKSDDGFKESNKMHGINGYIYGNGPKKGDHLRMKEYHKVAWYLLGIGNEVDVHTVHFHANTFIHRTTTAHVDDVYDVFPGVFETLEMVPTNPGTWLLHCHVHDHLEGGMETRYTVYKGPLWPPAGSGNSVATSIICLSTAMFLALLFLLQLE